MNTPYNSLLRFCRFIVLCLILFACMTGFSAEGERNKASAKEKLISPLANSGDAKVMAIKGKAVFSCKGTNNQDLHVGMLLQPGTTIETRANSQVDLYSRNNGPVIRILALSILHLKTMQWEERNGLIESCTVFELQKGTILGNAKKQSANSRYELRTPSGIKAVIQGGQYQFTDRGVLQISAGTANIEFIDANGDLKSHKVRSGEFFNADGKATSAIITEIPHTSKSNDTPPSYRGKLPSPFEYKRAF